MGGGGRVKTQLNFAFHESQDKKSHLISGFLCIHFSWSYTFFNHNVLQNNTVLQNIHSLPTEEICPTTPPHSSRNSYLASYIA